MAENEFFCGLHFDWPTSTILIIFGYHNNCVIHSDTTTRTMSFSHLKVLEDLVDEVEVGKIHIIIFPKWVLIRDSNESREFQTDWVRLPFFMNRQLPVICYGNLLWHYELLRCDRQLFWHSDPQIRSLASERTPEFLPPYCWFRKQRSVVGIHTDVTVLSKVGRGIKVLFWHIPFSTLMLSWCFSLGPYVIGSIF